MRNQAIVRQIAAKYHALSELMDERMRRQWAASEAQAYGWGGLQAVRVATGMSA
ncbi:MAG: ISAzo13 family transposase, partial [Gammaproteobacteria bacterium]